MSRTGSQQIVRHDHDGEWINHLSWEAAPLTSEPETRRELDCSGLEVFLGRGFLTYTLGKKNPVHHGTFQTRIRVVRATSSQLYTLSLPPLDCFQENLLYPISLSINISAFS